MHPRGRLLVLLIVAFLSGCLSSGREPETTVATDPPATPWSVAYVCGPGHDLESTWGCHGRLADASRTFGEPQIALHPADPGTFAIAVSDGRRPDAAVLGAPYVDVRGITVFVTGDGGESFREHVIPLQEAGDLAYNPGLMGADPALAFTPAGELHVVGLVITRPSERLPGQFETVLFHTQTSDLGATWSTLEVLDSAGFNDREWISASPSGDVMVSWRQHDETASAFISGSPAFEGAPTRLEGCRQISGAVWVDGVPIVACQVGTGDLQIFEAVGTATTARGTAGGACPSNSARLAGGLGGVLLATCYYGTFSVSFDGGWNWTSPRNVFDLVSVDDAWSPGIGPNIFAAAIDGRGMLHFTLSQFPSTDNTNPTGNARPVAHVVLDGINLSVIHELELQAESVEAPDGYGWADDYYAMEFVGTRGVSVWTSGDWATHFAVVEIPGVERPA